jgi:rhodanese-related sulfurtransferase
MISLNRQIIITILMTVLMSPLIMLINGCHSLKPFSDIEASDAVKLIQSNQNDADFVILDVRTAEEFATGYLAGAVNLDFKSADFTGRLDELDKTKTCLVYCRSGGRSAKAMGMMKEKGFQRVYNLRGGILDWVARELPLSGK